MAKDKGPPVFDPNDGLEVEKVGPWAVDDKHALVKRYVEITYGARRGYIGPGKAGSCLLDLFCSFGKVVDRESKVISDGGTLTAWKTSLEKSAPFSKLIIGDLKDDRVDACEHRLRAAGANVVALKGAANETVDRALAELNPLGLHLAYLDPYNIDALPFSVIEKLAKLQRVDFVVHFSTSDLQRNFDLFSAVEDGPLDRFAPGWRTAKRSVIKREQRQYFFEHWLSLLAGLGFKAGSIRHVKGGVNQTLYYLVYFSRHPLGLKLWDVTEKSKKQSDLF